MTTSFWRHAATSLPPEIRHRYAADFEAAERIEPVLDLVIGAWVFVTHALSRSGATVSPPATKPKLSTLLQLRPRGRRDLW